MKFISKLYTYIQRIREFLIFFILLLMVINTSLGVFFRYVLGQSLRWSYEFARYSMVWFAFLGMSLSLKKEKHVGITILVNQFSDKVKKIIYIFINLLVSFFLAVLIYYSFNHLDIVSYQTSPALGLNMRWPYLAVTMGSVLMIIESLRLVYLSIVNFNEFKVDYLEREQSIDSEEV